LALPGEDRAALAESLLASLDAHVNEDAEAAWAIEIHRRLTELDAGSVPTIPWSEVRQRLFERARHRALTRLRDGLDLRADVEKVSPCETAACLTRVGSATTQDQRSWLRRRSTKQAGDGVLRTA
jgi:putative addiction module component (TIGR02574 family)